MDISFIAIAGSFENLERHVRESTRKAVSIFGAFDQFTDAEVSKFGNSVIGN